MRVICQCVVLFTVVGAVPMFAIGCAGGSEKERSEKTVPAGTQPPAPDSSATLPPRKANLPDLPDGAGPMDDDAPEEFTSTRTGLYYRILRKTNGRKPRSFESVLAHYRGLLDNGRQFDSSYDRGEPAEFSLKGVVPGWTEGLQLIGEGGMIELEVPAKLGYGLQGHPPVIPPNATLHFIIEVKKIK